MTASSEEVHVFIDKKTLNSIPMFVDAFASPFWHAMDGDEPEEDSTTAEIFLMTQMCTTPGNLSKDKIMNLLKDEKNHLSVMAALSCLLNYDLDMRDVESSLQNVDEVEEIRKIVKLLPKWAKKAEEAGSSSA